MFTISGKYRLYIFNQAMLSTKIDVQFDFYRAVVPYQVCRESCDFR